MQAPKKAGGRLLSFGDVRNSLECAPAAISFGTKVKELEHHTNELSQEKLRCFCLLLFDLNMLMSKTLNKG